MLFEPLHFDQPENPVELLRKAAESINPVVIISLFNLLKTKAQPGTLMLLDQELNTIGTLPNAAVVGQLKTDAKFGIACLQIC